MLSEIGIILELFGLNVQNHLQEGVESENTSEIFDNLMIKKPERENYVVPYNQYRTLFTMVVLYLWTGSK